MPIIKTKEEIEVLRQGGIILNSILKDISQIIKPGVSTGDLEYLANKLIKKAGGRPAFKNYQIGNSPKFPTALCTSINYEVVHAPAFPSRILKKGDLIGIDLGMEFPIDGRSKIKNKYSKLGGFYTDMAQTFKVGKVDDETDKLVKTAQKCLELAILKVKPGANLNEIGAAIQGLAESQGFSVVRELVGHGVGYGVHEEPQVMNYRSFHKSSNIILKSGMVLAIEPMVNMGDWPIETAPDGLTILTRDRSLSAHFEHTVAVIEDGCLIITDK